MVSIKIILFSLFFCLASCQINVTFKDTNLDSIISGVATPFLGSIVQHQNGSLISSTYAAVCADPVYARLYELNSDGSVTEGNWKGTQLIGANARYTFNLKKLGLTTEEMTVNYLVKVQGCNGEVYKRPITDFDDKQDIDYKTSVIASIVNVDASELSKSLNEVPRSEIKKLIQNISGSSMTAAINSITNDSEPVSLFTTIFGASPNILLDSRPEVLLTAPLTNLNELQVHAFSVQTFHTDPNYSFAYRWKLDGVVKSSNATWNYIPGANSQGQHQIDVFVGKNNGSNDIDTSKPYYHRAFYVTVDNTIMPVAPAITINAATPSPRTTNTVDIDINTGTSFSNCDSFSEMAISETSTPPGPMTFTLACTDVATQTETVTFSNSDGIKQLFLWVRDDAGNVSLPKTVSFIHDGTAPTISITTGTLLAHGGETITFNYSSSDTTSSLASVGLYYAADGSTFSFIKNLSPTGTSDTFTIPSDNVSAAKLRIVATDAAGNTNSATSSAFGVDSTVPVTPSMTLSSNLYAQSKTVSLTAASCSTDQNFLLVNEGTQPLATDSSWQTCSNGVGVITYLIPSNTEGLHVLKVWVKDLAGNVSALAATVNMYLDLTAPSMSLSTVTSPLAGGSSQTLTISVTELHSSSAQNIAIEYFNGGTWLALGTKAMTNGPHTNASFAFNYTTPSIDTDEAKFRVTYADLAGRIAILTTPDFTVDSSGPMLNSLSLNNGNSNSVNSTVQVALSTNDTLTKISHFCLKYTTGVSVPTAPLANDSCWVAVNSPLPGVSPNKIISFNNYYYALGILSGTYHIFSWVKNELELISSLTNSGSGTLGIDYFQINFTAGVPPTLLNVISSKVDTTSLMVPSSDLAVSSGETIYVKWKASDDQVLPSNSITISYTTNEVTYTTVASNLPNAATGGCSVDGTNYTGCFATTAPANSYFKFRVSITDSSNMISLVNATPNNMGAFYILAGNTEPGLGGSASNAVFNLDSGLTVGNLPGSFVVSDTGIFYIRDRVNGILKIDPANGIVQQLIPYSTTKTDGPIGTATMKSNNAFMTIDYEGNLLFFDEDRIRKVNLTTNMVSTVIGGGATRASNTDAASFQINTCTTTKYCPITALPNGDIYISDSPNTTGAKIIWKYEASSARVFAITATGTGISTRPASDDVSSSSYKMLGFSLEYDVTNSNITKTIIQMMPDPCPGCGSTGYTAFVDIATGATIPSPTPAAIPSSTWNFKSSPTAKNGKIYFLAQEGNYKLTKFDSVSNSWTTVLGTGSSGFCADGTDALSCNVFAMDAFITADSRIFFISNGLIRTIDSNNKVQTVFGQRRVFGDNGLATSARINSAPFFDFFSNGDIVFYDANENIIRSFQPGGMMTKVAGNGTTSSTNGSAATATGLLGTWWGGKSQMVVNPTNDDIYFMNSTRISRVKKSDGILNHVIGGGGTGYHAADSLTGNLISITLNEIPDLLGIRNGQLLLSMSQRNGSAQNYRCYTKFYDINDSYRQSHFAGNENVCTNAYPADGTSATSANVGVTSSNTHLMAEWFPDHSAWIIPRANTAVLKSYAPGGTVQTVATLPRAIISFTIVKNASNQNVVYYCSGTTGIVYKYNIATSTETALAWPGNSYTCTGFKIKYHTGRGSIIFPYTKSGLAGIAEIVDIP